MSLIKTFLLGVVVVMNEQSSDASERIKSHISVRVNPFDLDVLIVSDPDVLGPHHVHVALDAKTNECVSVLEEKLTKRRTHPLRLHTYYRRQFVSYEI